MDPLLPPMFLFTAFGIKADRAAEISIAMVTDIVFESIDPDNSRWAKDTLLYIRKNMNKWADTHAEANYLYFTAGRFLANTLTQLSTIVIRGNKTRKEFSDKMQEIFAAHIEKKTSPLN